MKSWYLQQHGWMDLEMIILSEVSQTVKDKYHMISLTCRILKNDTNEWTYFKTEIDSDTALMPALGNQIIGSPKEFIQEPLLGLSWDEVHSSLTVSGWTWLKTCLTPHLTPQLGLKVTNFWNYNTSSVLLNPLLFFSFFLSFFLSSFFLLFRTTPKAYGGSQVRHRIGATASSLHLSHSNMGSKLHLCPTPWLTAMLDPWPT